VSVKLDTAGIKKLGLQLRFLDDLHLSFGVLSPNGSTEYTGGVNLATVALYAEYGTPDAAYPSPARSFLRSTLVEKKQEITDKAVRELRAAVLGKKTSVKALSSVGEYVVSLVRLRIASSNTWAKPNAPATVKDKGFNWPLHETMRLSKSISWQIRSGGPNGPVVAKGK